MLHATLDALTEPLLVLDNQGRVVLANRVMHRLHHQLAGRTLTELTHPVTYRLLGGLLGENAAAGVQAVLDGSSPHYEMACAYELGAERCSLKLLVRRPEPLGGAVLVFRDLTEQARREADIYTRANLDPLTALLNRRLFFTKANRTLALAERHGHPFALVYLDLDGFKAVNDRSGHEVGDEVLCRVAERLKGLLRESDLLARLGGDEFLLLLPETDAQESSSAVARYAESLARPFVVEDAALTLSGSFGVAHYPTDGQTIDGLVRLADRAMYSAKTRGGGMALYNAAAPDLVV